MFKFNVSRELREQIVNIIDDLVNDIAPGYLSPNSFSRFDYRTAIYEAAYKSLSAEFGMRRLEYVDYRHEIFDFLREVPSEKFFNVIGHLLKVMCEGVHIQKTIHDDIIPNPHAGNELWSRKASVRDKHIRLFKGAVDILNHRLAQSNAKYRYELSGESLQMVGLDTGLDAPKQNSGVQKENGDIQESDDNQTPKHHQKRSRRKYWDWKNRKVEYVLVGLALSDFLIGDRLLIRGIDWLWNHLPTILENIFIIFR